MKDLAQEQLRPLMLRIFEEFVRRINFDNLALIHKDHAACNLPGKPHLVGDTDHGHTLLSERYHGVEHFFYHFRIKR